MLHRRGITLIELLVVIAVVALLIGLLAPSLAGARGSARQVKDASQLRSIHQSMIMWARSHADEYPLPSRLDRSNATIAANRPKDLPRHIISILIFNRFIPPEVCISPAEANPNMKVYRKYSYSDPAGASANHKALAQWDPAFRAVQNEVMSYVPNVGSDPGNFSYALMPPVGARRPRWINTFDPNHVVLGNRGPAFGADSAGAGLTWRLLGVGTPQSDQPFGQNSYTLRIHGSPNRWEGHFVFNDNHVRFERQPDPTATVFNFDSLGPGQVTQRDNIFANENDLTRTPESETLDGAAGANTNNYLRVWNDGTFVTDSKRLQVLTSIRPWYD